MKLVRLFDGEKSLKSLASETVDMIHLTKNTQAIKRLLGIYDILELNIYIQQTFKEVEETWDFAALRDMNIKRAEIMIYHHIDFEPFKNLYKYNNKLSGFLRVLAHKYEKDDLIPITQI